MTFWRHLECVTQKVLEAAIENMAWVACTGPVKKIEPPYLRPFLLIPEP